MSSIFITCITIHNVPKILRNSGQISDNIWGYIITHETGFIHTRKCSGSEPIKNLTTQRNCKEVCWQWAKNLDIENMHVCALSGPYQMPCKRSTIDICQIHVQSDGEKENRWLVCFDHLLWGIWHFNSWVGPYCLSFILFILGGPDSYRFMILNMHVRLGQEMFMTYHRMLCQNGFYGFTQSCRLGWILM